eukprot:GHVS01035580.1.p2 GENE.GHVS01035580.1~~GHVS01035580.1.p2  ORF type:complete len:266 (-),score=34.82 GHVS01035580.1:2144-2941(-)
MVFSERDKLNKYTVHARQQAYNAGAGYAMEPLKRVATLAASMKPPHKEASRMAADDPSDHSSGIDTSRTYDEVAAKYETVMKGLCAKNAITDQNSITAVNSARNATQKTGDDLDDVTDLFRTMMEGCNQQVELLERPSDGVSGETQETDGLEAPWVEQLQKLNMLLRAVNRTSFKDKTELKLLSARVEELEQSNEALKESKAACDDLGAKNRSLAVLLSQATQRHEERDQRMRDEAAKEKNAVGQFTAWLAGGGRLLTRDRPRQF